MKNTTMVISYFLIISLMSLSIFTGVVFAQTEEDLELMFNQAKSHVINGEYKEANKIYDDILETAPSNISTLKMKGIVQSNLGEHTQSLKQFFKVLQYAPNDVISLTGMGVGFGNLGEYQEAKTYFDKALKEKPNSVVINNYQEFIEKVILKYPYTPTEKPEGLERVYTTTIPEWVRPLAKWWSEGNIKDGEFISSLSYLIENRIVQIPPIEVKNDGENTVPEWVKNNAGKWADGLLDENSFVEGIQQMIENRIIIVNVQEVNKSEKQLEHEFYLFEKYLRSISNNISKEIRYIEYPNPSKDVIKKFLRDYVKWNFEEEVKIASESFPNPTYEIIDDVVIIYYNVFINDQPQGLPLDHVSTLKNSFLFWEEQELEVNNQKAKVKFEVVNFKHEANVWVTWVVRDIGEGVLGHAHLGKGVVEVTLGDYNCDGSFQLYDVNSVETIMTHELGHSIGLQHIEDQNNIMYPSYSPSYAYCLLG